MGAITSMAAGILGGLFGGRKMPKNGQIEEPLPLVPVISPQYGGLVFRQSF